MPADNKLGKYLYPAVQKIELIAINFVSCTFNINKNDLYTEGKNHEKSLYNNAYKHVVHGDDAVQNII